MPKSRGTGKETDLTYDWQQLAPSDAAEAILKRDPRQFPWGYYERDYDSWGSAALFFWFASTDEMLAFIAEVRRGREGGIVAAERE